MALTQDQISAPALKGGTGFVALPASNATPLAVSCMGVLITTAGNLGLILADGTNNNSTLVAVTAGQYFYPMQAIATSASNTAGVIGVR